MPMWAKSNVIAFRGHYEHVRWKRTSGVLCPGGIGIRVTFTPLQMPRWRNWQIYTVRNAAVAELEYAYGSEPYVERLVGSNPTRGISNGTSGSGSCIHKDVRVQLSPAAFVTGSRTLFPQGIEGILRGAKSNPLGGTL